MLCRFLSCHILHTRAFPAILVWMMAGATLQANETVKQSASQR
jgi:hypothetical protein